MKSVLRLALLTLAPNIACAGILSPGDPPLCDAYPDLSLRP